MKAEQAVDEMARNHFCSQASKFLRAHFREIRAQEACANARKGSVIPTRPKLHRIKEMVLSAEASGPSAEGRISTDRREWNCEVEMEFLLVGGHGTCTRHPYLRI